MTGKTILMKAPKPGTKISERQFWKQVDDLQWPKRRLDHIDFEKERQLLLKEWPVEYWSKFFDMGQAKAEALGDRLGLGSNDFRLDFTADIVGHGKKMYDRMMTDPSYAQEILDSKNYGVENFLYFFLMDKDGAEDVSKEELSEAYTKIKGGPSLKDISKEELMASYDRLKRSSEKVSSKKKVARKSAPPEWKRLISRCQKLWNQYLERPSKKALKDVLAHLEKMEKSASEKVKKERARCLRVANQEAKRLGIR